MIEHETEQTVFEPRDPLVGTTLDGRFRIDARLAAGGFGAIYRATDLRSDQEIALKVLHANLSADPLIVARFRREGETLASLRDPHTVTAYELGEAEDGTLYIVMELLRGETLYDAYRRHGGPLPWRRVTAIARAVCSSLAEAHARGIVHRDLKPANIHLQERDGNRDFVKVLDFGIAKILRGSELDASELTMAGQMIGTFDYMAPEQMLGGVVGASCDIYTLGVVVYEMLTGRLPFADATSPTHLLAMLLTTQPPAVGARAPVPPALDRVVMRCLERESQDRYASVVELAGDLDRVLAGGVYEEPPTLVAGQGGSCEAPTRVARGGSDRSQVLPPVPPSAPTRLTPSGAAQLRAALTPAQPVEPIGEVRAQGSQPVIAPYAGLRNDGRSSQPAMRSDGRGSQPALRNDGRSSQPAMRSDGRSSQPAMAFDATVPARSQDDRGSQPVMAAHAQPQPCRAPHTPAHGQMPAQHRQMPHTPAHGQMPAAHGQMPHTPAHGQMPAAHGQMPHTPAHGQMPAPHRQMPHTPAHGQLPHTPPHGQMPYAPAHGQLPHTPPHAYPQYVDPRAAMYPGADASRSSQAAMPAYAERRSQPVLEPGHDPRAPYPVCDGCGSQPYVDPYVDPRASQLAMHAPAWPAGPRQRTDGAAFDAARDAAVRRIVWALVLILGTVLAVIVAKLV